MDRTAGKVQKLCNKIHTLAVKYKVGTWAEVAVQHMTNTGQDIFEGVSENLEKRAQKMCERLGLKP